MGFFSEDMAPMLGVFEAETSDLAGVVNRIIARVEHEGAFTPEDVAELFRCVHTIKGSSAMMGLNDLSSLSHKVEDLFDILRTSPSLAEGREADILDHLYAFSDYVGDELGRMSDDDYAPADPGGLIERISSDVALLAGHEGEGASGEAADAHAQVERSPVEDEGAADAQDESGVKTEHDMGAEGDASCATLKIGFKPDVAMVNARALVIMKQLGSQVGVVSHVPADLAAADSSRVIAENGLLVTVNEADVEAAKRFLAKNSFIRRISVIDDAPAAADVAPARQERQAAEQSQAGDKFVTLRWSNVHALQDLAGEFLLHASELKALSADVPENGGMRNVVSQTVRLVDELVYRINSMAMVSMSTMVPQLSRMVRDMCRDSGKQVSFEVHGSDIEIDRNLYNSILDPLIHIIRNAVDHGIELPDDRLVAGKEARGNVSLTVENLGARVAFRVSDDGRGVDTEEVLAKAAARGMLDKPVDQYTRPEVLRMVLLAGLSTAKEVTQYSGRGVGMDVVSEVVRDFNGQIDIDSKPGQGTSMTLFMPVSVTSVESLVFRIGRTAYHMPLFNLSKIYVADEAEGVLSHFEGGAVLVYEKRQVPVLDMHRLLACQGENAFYIVCHSMGEEFVIGVDEIVGEFGCSNKPLPACLGREWQEACPIRNVSILGDGTIGYALNAALLATLARDSEKAYERADAPRVQDAVEPDYDLMPVSDLPESAFVFMLGDNRCAVPVNWVERLVPMPACAEAPRGLPYLMGLSNYHNRAIAVFDLARSAGVADECPYALVLDRGGGECEGFSITSAIGVRSLDGAVLADEQPEFRAFAAGYRSAGLFVPGPKELPIMLLDRD